MDEVPPLLSDEGWMVGIYSSFASEGNQFKFYEFMCFQWRNQKQFKGWMEGRNTHYNNHATVS